MPKIYLSPSVQEYNHYIDGGNEEYYMYLIADAMEPYLRANNIDFDRNQPEMTLAQVINDSNAQNYDLHLAIHSNASPESSAGKNTGAEIYYYPTSVKGKQFAAGKRKSYPERQPCGASPHKSAGCAYRGGLSRQQAGGSVDTRQH